MIELQDSIKKYGVLNPLIVRPKIEGYYEIISGHRRKYAAEKLGYKKIPVIICMLQDDEAVVIMVDSNLQREQITPSEKAYAYKMKYDAIKKKAGRKNCSQVDHNTGKRSIDIIGELCGDSAKQVQRYIKITELIPALLDKVDDGTMGFTPAKVIADFREKTEEHFHPVDRMNAGEIEEMVSYYVQAKIIENDLDAQVENVIISGSRCRGTEKNGSDLDVVVDYKGTIREDDFFNILHEDGFTIAGIAIDVNPITEDKRGLLAEYLESAEQYLKEKAQERKLEKPSVREKIKRAKQVQQDKQTGNIEKSKSVER